MTLYTKIDCPLCNVVKVKMVQAGIDYTPCINEDKMNELNIDRLPVLQLDTGELLEFKAILNYIEEVKNNEN